MALFPVPVNGALQSGPHHHHRSYNNGPPFTIQAGQVPRKLMLLGLVLACASLSKSLPLSTVRWHRPAPALRHLQPICVEQAGSGHEHGHDRSAMMLPLRLGAYTALMALSFPPCLMLSFGRALYQRTKGTPDQILPSGSINAIGSGGGYAGQMYFAKRLDISRLRGALDSVAADAGIPRDQTAVVDAGFPRGPCEGAIAGASVIDGPKGEGSTWLEGWADDAELSGKTIGIRAFNIAADERLPADGTPAAALQFNLPGMAWDGSACFNFMKELVHRYCGGEPNDVFRAEQVRLSPHAAGALRGTPGAFARYLCRLPHSVLTNTHSYVWHALCSAPRRFGGPGLGLHCALINFTPEESASLAAGLRRRGASPFAGLTHSAVVGYERTVGRMPRGIVQQASLVTAAYQPIVPERNLVGDWLVGPYRRIPRASAYTLEDAEAGYRELRANLANCEGAVRRAFEAKAYGLLNGGAAAFEAPPTYGDANSLMDSIFFNNYGTRSIHPDAECIGWNWGVRHLSHTRVKPVGVKEDVRTVARAQCSALFAPFGLGCNCIFINGRTCICFASSILGRDQLERVRDQAEEVLRGFMLPGAAASERQTVDAGSV